MGNALARSSASAVSSSESIPDLSGPQSGNDGLGPEMSNWAMEPEFCTVETGPVVPREIVIMSPITGIVRTLIKEEFY